MTEQLANLPDITFIDGITLDDVNDTMVAAYEERYKELNGRPLQLTRADPETLKLYAGAVMIFHVLTLLESAGLDNMLATSEGSKLDGLAALKKVHRLPAQQAQVLVRFTLSAQLDTVQTIPAGTKVTPGRGIYFATVEQVEIPAGDISAVALCRCTTAGKAGSGYAIGRINTLVDRLPYIASVSNITESQGGTDIESDESLRDRTYLAPDAYTTAGSYDAYAYHTRSYSQSITSVHIISPKPGEVEIRVLLEHGDLPNEAFLEGLRAHLSADTKRPLTDHLTVLAPTKETYDLDATYYIARSRASSAVTIQAQVAKAVQEYIDWQSAEIGRDLNPCELIMRMVAAGAKRVDVAAPAFTTLPSTAIATLGTSHVTYGGLEDD